MTTYYAAPEAGSGGNAIGSSSNNGLSQSVPFRVVDFWGVANPGDTLKLLNGVYTGSNSMISPPAGFSGTNGNYITISALNDGGVIFDGEFNRTPVTLQQGSSWFLMEGFDARRAGGAIIVVRPDASNNVFRRLVIYDSAFTGGSRFLLHGSCSNNLIEDVAIFGTGTNGVHLNGSGTNNLCRRVWVRFEGSSSQNGKRNFTLNYKAQTGGLTLENCISVWEPRLGTPQAYDTDDPDFPRLTNYVVIQLGSLFHGGSGDGGVENPCINSRVSGSLAYIRHHNWPYWNGGNLPGNLANSANIDCIRWEHTIAWYDPQLHAITTTRGFLLRNPHPQISAFAGNISSIAGAPDTFDEDYGGTSRIRVNDGLSGLNAVNANPWTGTQGANLCHKWVNGVNTGQPLWPWPMAARIRAATEAAGGAFSSGNPCGNCVSPPTIPRTTDLMTEIQAILGPIPSQCWNDNNLLVSNAPPVLPLPSSATPPTGPSTLNNSPTFGGNTSAPLPDGTSFVPGECTNAVVIRE